MNQRGQIYYNSGYGIDMWLSAAQVSDINIKDGYVSIKNYFVQKFEQDMEFGVKQYTFSCALTNGAICAAQIIDNNATYENLCEGLSVATQNNELYLWSENRTTDIQAVKLEVGSISTLALDLMQPSNYAAELRKCQRYLQVIKLYGRAPFVYTAGKARNVVKYDQVQLRPNMRIAPSIAKIISNKFFSEKNNSWMHDGTLTLNNSCVSEVNVYNNYYSILGDDNVLDTELIFLLSAEL